MCQLYCVCFIGIGQVIFLVLRVFSDFSPFFVCLIVLDDLGCYAACDFWCFLVLPKILHKLAVRVHQVHDDGVVHLEGGGERSGFTRGRGEVRVHQVHDGVVHLEGRGREVSKCNIWTALRLPIECFHVLVIPWLPHGNEAMLFKTELICSKLSKQKHEVQLVPKDTTYSLRVKDMVKPPLGIMEYCFSLQPATTFR